MALVDLKSKLNEFGENNPRNPYQKGDRETELKSNVKIDSEKYLEKGQKRKSDLTNQGSKLDRRNTPKSTIPRKESNTLLSFGRSIKSFIQDFGLSSYDVPTSTNYEDTIKRESADTGGFEIDTKDSNGRDVKKRVTLGSISRDIKSIGSSFKSAKEILKGNVSKGIKTAIEGTQENKLREYNATAYGKIKHMGEPGRKVSNVDGTLAKGFQGPIKGGVKSKNVNRANIEPISDTINDNLDLIPFRFYDKYNDKHITFSAILSGITDTITPEYSSERYIGRPDSVYIYQGVERAISFTFDVYPQTRQEMPVLWEKINYLVSLCYPNFESINFPVTDENLGLDEAIAQSSLADAQTMVSPMVELTIGDLYNQTPGFLSGITMTVQDNTTWEFEYDKDSQEQGSDKKFSMRLPHYVQIACEFTHIPRHTPQVGGKHFELNWTNPKMPGQFDTPINRHTIQNYFSKDSRDARKTKRQNRRQARRDARKQRFNKAEGIG